MAADDARSDGLSRRETRWENLRERTRSQILDAAEQAFAANGYQRAQLREIAKLAGYSVGALYTAFESKDALFRAVVNRRGEEFLAEMVAVMSADLSSIEQLHELAAFQVGYFREHPSFARIVLRSSLIAPVGDPLPEDDDIAGRMASSLTIQTDLFRRGQVSGELRSGPPEVLARIFSGIISAYQAAEAWAPAGQGALPLADLHDVLEGAFAAPKGAVKR